MALCNLHFKFEHPHHLSFRILSPPTRGKYWYCSFIEIMSIWKQMDRQQERETHAKLIGATHPISHFQNTLSAAVTWPVQGGRHIQRVPRASPEHPQSIPALVSTNGITQTHQTQPGERPGISRQTSQITVCEN